VRILTVYQPWASLECLGLKGTETRGHGTSYRGPLLIHAGMRWDPWQRRVCHELDVWLKSHGSVGLPTVANLPFGAVLAVAELAHCEQVTEETATSFSEFDRIAGDLSVGRWVWVLDKVRPLREPIPWRGQQGLRTAPEELVRAVRDQVGREDRIPTPHAPHAQRPTV
jgi:activating signal cointegrator 1